MSTTSVNRDEFLDLGTHCSEASCHQLDFLPFKCPSCTLPFCADHWRPPSGHTCASYDAIAADNIIPSCPLCSVPISYPLRTDPNIAMDQHLSTACVSLHPHLKNAKLAPGSMPVCEERRCKTKMVVPISCDKCKGRYCASHRWTTDHACLGKPPGAMTATSSKGKGSMAGLAALRRAQGAIKSSGGASKATTSSTKKTAPLSTAAKLGSRANPIVLDDTDSDVEIVEPKSKVGTVAAASGKKALAAIGGGTKTDKRARAEQESARKALEARAKKGLLSETEKVQYATLQALNARKGSKSDKDGCMMS